MGQHKWQLSSQKARIKSSASAHNKTRTFFFHPLFLPNIWYSFLAAFGKLLKPWKKHCPRGFCCSGVRESNAKNECVLGHLKQSWDHKVFFLVIAMGSLKSEQKKFDPVFGTIQIWPNLSLEPLPLKTRSSRFSFLWSLSSWRKWSNLSCVLKLWLMRRVWWFQSKMILQQQAN